MCVCVHRTLGSRQWFLSVNATNLVVEQVIENIVDDDVHVEENVTFHVRCAQFTFEDSVNGRNSRMTTCANPEEK